MISIDLDLALSLYISLILVLVFMGTIAYNCHRGKKEDVIYQKSRYLEQCPYCTHIFFDYHESSLKVCPQCKSYLTVEKRLK